MKDHLPKKIVLPANANTFLLNFWEKKPARKKKSAFMVWSR